jgi:hypothetical protein
MTQTFPSRRWRLVMSGLAAMLLVSLLVATAQGRGAAAQFLAQFRGERFAAVQLSTGQIANIQLTMSDLQHLGTIGGLDTGPAPQTVANVAEASQAVGFPVFQPDPASLPDGMNGTPPEVRVVPPHQVRFTFDQTRARAYFQSLGRNDVVIPERFDGASLVVNTPPAVLLKYGSTGAGTASPLGVGLLIGEAGELTASAEGGVTLEELRNFLLGLPGLSPETVDQLQGIENWKTTLPVPIPVDQVNWERATIDGSPGLLLNDNTGLGSAAIWQSDGRIFGIAGAMKARELQRVADTLH